LKKYLLILISVLFFNSCRGFVYEDFNADSLAGIYSGQGYTVDYMVDKVIVYHGGEHKLYYPVLKKNALYFPVKPGGLQIIGYFHPNIQGVFYLIDGTDQLTLVKT